MPLTEWFGCENLCLCALLCVHADALFFKFFLGTQISQLRIILLFGTKDSGYNLNVLLGPKDGSKSCESLSS